MNTSKRYSLETRERAVRLVQKQEAEHESQWTPISSIAPKVGCTKETLPRVERLGSGIENGHFAGLELFAETVWDEEHATSAAFNRALRALYPPSPSLITRARRE